MCDQIFTFYLLPIKKRLKKILYLVDAKLSEVVLILKTLDLGADLCAG